MAVNVIWSTSNGGTGITENVDHGKMGNGETTLEQKMYLRHDGGSDITGVALYIRAYSGTYSGSATAEADVAELIGWGNEKLAYNFGGLFINWNALAGYPTIDWPTLTHKTALSTKGFVHRSGTGDSLTNAITLPACTGAENDGLLQSGSSPNVRFKMKIQVPITVDLVGIRLFDHVVTYLYTS